MLIFQIYSFEPFPNRGLQLFKFKPMSTQKSLVIAQPCHENWGKMTPTEKGRFCDSCTKEVVDFRSKKKEDVIEYLENYRGEGQTCGQFHPAQIDEVGKNYIHSSFFKRAGISFLAFLGFFSFKEAKGQQKMGKVAIKGDVSYKEWDESKQKMEVTIFGSVRTLTGDKISGAEISLQYEGKQLAIAKTIANGSFTVKLQVDKSMKAITLYTKADGYEIKSNVIPNPQKERIKVDVIMESEIMVLGQIAIRIDTIQPIEEEKTVDTLKTCGETYTEDSTSSITEKVETIPVTENTPEDSTEILPKIELYADQKWLKVYPNPSSENATIEWKHDGDAWLEIFDLNGKKIWTASMKGTKTVFNTAHLSNGNYLVKITYKLSGITETAQLTVQH